MWRRFVQWVDRLWGYDVFIAHRRTDAAGYAKALHDRLAQERISSFVDRVVYLAGDNLSVVTSRHAAKSSILVLLGTPRLLQARTPTDWVHEELHAYLRAHRTDPKVVVVDFGGVVGAASSPLPAGGDAAGAQGLLRDLAAFIRLEQPAGSWAQAPSDELLGAIRANLKGRRRDRLRVRVFGSAAIALAILLAVAVQQALSARASLREALVLDGRRLAAEADRQRIEGKADVAGLLAREALDGIASHPEGMRRPYVPDAAFSLARALAARPLAVSRIDYAEGVNVLAISPDRDLLLVLSENGNAEVRRVATMQKLGPSWRTHAATPHAAAFSPDGRRFATAAHDGSIVLWQTEDRRPAAEFNAGAPVRAIRFTTDGLRLLAATDEGAMLFALSGTEPVEKLICFGGKGSPVGAIALGSAGKQAAVACARGGTHIWTLGRRRPDRIWPDASPPTSIAFSPDGAQIVTGHANGALVWRTARTGHMLRTVAGHEQRVKDLTYSPDGQLLLSSSDDSTAGVWDARSGEALYRLRGHASYVMGGSSARTAAASSRAPGTGLCGCGASAMTRTSPGRMPGQPRASPQWRQRKRAVWQRSAAGARR